jgi:hypothetical protein
VAERGAAAATDSQTPEGGTPLAGADPVYLENPVLDATVRMLVELSAQVWVERERRLSLEALLEQRGVLAREAIESLRPDAEFAARLREERNRFIDDVFKELRRIPVSPPRSPPSAGSA